ncbi:MAG: hypothetical protein WAV28_05155, partial [Sedimentisphaerales bacterium]
AEGFGDGFSLAKHIPLIHCGQSSAITPPASVQGPACSLFDIQTVAFNPCNRRFCLYNKRSQ